MSEYTTRASANNWKRASAGCPCPICDRPDWCSISGDGAVAKCMRVEAGAFKSGEDSAGGRYFLHRLTGATPQRPGSTTQRGDPETLHRVYTALLKLLPLTPEHREQLRRRGLTDAEIDRRGYRSHRLSGRAARATSLHKSHGDAVLSVPGLGYKDGERGPYLTIFGPVGILIPVRDPAARIVALKVRRDDDKTPKYLYLSSKKHGGPGSGSPVHVPLGVQGPIGAGRLTEGELKADLATVLSGLPTVGAPSAGGWRPALKVLQELGCKTVHLAFDRDAQNNPIVARSLLACAKAVQGAGLALALEDWSGAPQALKGIDDLLAAGQTPKVLTSDQAVDKIAETAAAAGVNAAAEKEREKGKKSQSTRLVEYALGALDLFHTPERDAYVTTRGNPRQTWPLRSKAARQWLGKLFYEREERAPGGEALSAALNTLEGKANFASPEHAVAVRVAEWDSTLFLDLGDRDWRAVALRPGRWELTAAAPVKFRRSRGTLALPEPTRSGSLDALRRFVNVGDDDDWRLLIGWLLATLRPRGPYPVLCLHGEQGSAKSTTARAIRSLIDPNSAALRAEPRDARDLIITANNSWVVALDNLSILPPWLSDALCRLATGGGFSTRELYTDADEVLFDAQRPCLLTGIEELATRGDLLERCLMLTLPAIAEEDRRTEADFWKAFEEARPQVLGALLDVAAAGLQELPRVKLPRMADFAAWVTACAPALGWQPGDFLRAYTDNQAAANSLALETSAVVAPLRKLVEEQGAWEGTASELLQELGKRVGEAETKSREWPKKPHILSGRLRRLAPHLRKSGIGIIFDRDGDKKRGRKIRAEMVYPERPKRPKRPTPRFSRPRNRTLPPPAKRPKTHPERPKRPAKPLQNRPWRTLRTLRTLRRVTFREMVPAAVGSGGRPGGPVAQRPAGRSSSCDDH